MLSFPSRTSSDSTRWVGSVVTAQRQQHRVVTDVPDFDVLASPEPTRIGDEHFDDEPTAGREVVGHALEAAALRVAVAEGEERAVDDADQREATVDGHVGEVADRDRDAVAARLGPELRDHRLAGVDPGDRDAAFGERQGEPPGPDGELERGAGSGQVRQERDRGVGVGRVRRQLVVDVGDAIAVGGGVVTFPAVHRSIASDAPAGGGPFVGTASIWSPPYAGPPSVHPEGEIRR